MSKVDNILNELDPKYKQCIGCKEYKLTITYWRLTCLTGIIKCGNKCTRCIAKDNE